MRNRRSFLKGIGAVGSIGLLAGCSGGSSEPTAADDGTPTDEPANTGGSTPTATERSTPTPEPGPEVTFGGNEEINFNLSPSVPQENLYLQYAPVRDYLESFVEKQYDVPEALDAKMNIGSNYSAVIQALGQGTADVAETGPFGAAVGHMTGNSEVVLQRHGYGSWTYKSLIAVPNDSDIESLADLEGKTVSFSDPLSTSGFLYPVAAMKEAGIDIGNLPEGNGSQAAFEPVFAGGHVQSYTNLEQGQVDAAGMGGFVRDTGAGPAPAAWQEVATTLHEDTGLPRAPIVVSSELSADARSAIQEAFLQAPDRIYLGADGEDGGDDDLWFDGVREADIDTYRSVIDKAETLGIGADFFA
jgi:phosphonate transport system substrate-binding protein